MLKRSIGHTTYYQFTVGRKLENWSQLDNFWHLGVWQPHLRHQGFSFSAQGLTGVFGQWSGQQWKALVFASPLFLPDQGPKVEVREGQLFVRNRWFSHPVDRVRIGELSSPLAFKLIEPEISEVVFQNQVAGQFIFADGLYGNWGSMAYAYKPINQFYIGLRPIHHVSSSNVNKITEIEVYPQIRYHHLATVEVGRRWHQGEVWASVIRDEPVNKDVPVLWVSQEFPPVWLFGIGASTNIKLPFFRNLHFSGSYLQRQSDDQKPNEFLNSNLEVLSDRFIFTEALAVEMEWFRPIRSNLKISMNTRFIHSLAFSGETLSLELGVHSTRGWLTQVGAEFIGSNNPNGSDFFNQYRANDRIYGGVGYVF